MKRSRIMHYILHDMKFKNKLSLICLFLVLAPSMVIIAFLYSQLSHTIQVNTIGSEKALFNQTTVSLESTINSLNQAMDSITSSSYLSKASFSDDISAFFSENQDNDAAINFFSNINALIDHELIKDIRIYIPSDTEPNMKFTKIDNVIKPESIITASYWHGIFNGRPELTSLLCPRLYLTPYECENLSSTALIRKFSNFLKPDSGDIYIAIYFSSEYLNDVLEGHINYSDSLYYIINSRNSIVAASDPASVGTYFMRYENIPLEIKNMTDFTITKILDVDLYMGYRNLKKTDWRLVSVIPAKNINSTTKYVLFKSLVLYLLFATFAFFVAFSFSTSITNRLSLIVDKMNQHRKSMPEKFSDTSDGDELGQLLINYNTMVDRINMLMDEQAASAEKLKMSEVNALQAQINPHFLYNMLDMINWLSQSGKHTEVSQAVQTLSKFYKLTLSKKEINTTVKNELTHAELYVKLQNMRYEDSIDFIVDVPDMLMEYEIPKLVLQPVVENSILHGILEKETKTGSVVITAWVENNDMIFTVSDDGVGMNSDTLRNILSGDSESNRGGSNIAIFNTHLRLQLLFGEAYGLKYESTLGRGTDVTIRLPLSNEQLQF